MTQPWTVPAEVLLAVDRARVASGYRTEALGVAVGALREALDP